nr:uncharacterized protein C18orf25 homolog [Cavia porcellus]
MQEQIYYLCIVGETPQVDIGHGLFKQNKPETSCLTRVLILSSMEGYLIILQNNSRNYFLPQKLDTSIHFLSSLDGPPVVAHYDISDTSSDPEVVNVDNLLAAAVVQEHTNSVGGQDTGATWRTSGLPEELNAEAGHLDPGFLASDKTSASNAPLNEEINIASSDSEVEIVGVQEHARCVHPRGGVIQSVSSWKHGSGTQYVSSRQTQSWTTVTPQQTWASPAEVVDLTLDEDSRRKYLL